MLLEFEKISNFVKLNIIYNFTVQVFYSVNYYLKFWHVIPSNTPIAQLVTLKNSSFSCNSSARTHSFSSSVWKLKTQ